MVRKEQLFGVGCSICGWANPQNATQAEDTLTEVFDEKEHIEVITELPAATEGSIIIDVKDNVLLISTDDYNRTVPLSFPVGPDVETTYNNGVLVIKLKKR